MNAAIHTAYILNATRPRARVTYGLDLGSISRALTGPLAQVAGVVAGVGGSVVGAAFGMVGLSRVGDASDGTRLQTAIANQIAAHQALDAANAAIAAGGTDFAGQMQAITDAADADAEANSAAAAAGAMAGNSIADQILADMNKPTGPATPPVVVVPPAIVAPPAPVAAKSHLLRNLAIALGVGIAGYAAYEYAA